ncbi:MAG: HesA/MoeB/ThiF family protein [Planctomycetota bacterium]
MTAGPHSGSPPGVPLSPALEPDSGPAGEAQGWRRIYDRQARLPQVGPQGQAKLAQATVGVLGCGALGSVTAQWLARAGVGTLLLIDRDVVEPTNLQRQLLYDRDDAATGRPKVEAACEQIRRINPDVRAIPLPENAGPDTIERLCGLAEGSEVPRADVLVDGFDGYHARYVANDCALAHGVPLVHGGAVGTSGSMLVVLPAVSRRSSDDAEPAWLKQGGATIDLATLFGAPPPPGSTPTCETAGVLGPAVGVVASLQAAEAIKILLGDWASVSRDLWRIDLWEGRIDRFATPRPEVVDPDSLALPYLRAPASPDDGALCGRDVVQVSPAAAGAPIDLQALGAQWRVDHGDRVSATPHVARLSLTEGEAARALTVFRDGRTLVHGAADTAAARALVDRYVRS